MFQSMRIKVVNKVSSSSWETSCLNSSLSWTHLSFLKIRLDRFRLHRHVEIRNFSPAFNPSRLAPVEPTHAQGHTLRDAIRWRLNHTTQHSSLLFFLYFLQPFLYLRFFFPFLLLSLLFGTTYLGWHVRLFLKQTSIQSLHLVASKVWIQLIKIKVYIFPPYFTHKIKTLFGPPQKRGY